MKNMPRFFCCGLLVVVFCLSTISLHAQWVQTNGPYGARVYCFAVSGTNLFAGISNGGVFLSTNNGTSWTAVNTGLTDSVGVNALAVSGTNLFAGTEGGVFLSTNNGTSWTAVNSGLTNLYVMGIGASGRNLFAGTYSGGVWRRPLSEMITSVEGLSPELPKHFSLEQNYPNPFNPATTIQFTIPSGTYGRTSLRVYNVLGNEVAILVNEQKSPGTYALRWDASGMPSGVYFYRLRAGQFVETKKLILLR